MRGKKPGTVRIIGGEWRGRRLPVPDIEGLRPSGDRGRETLFNWLKPHLHRARCVDLFAGTGVLGLEAVSRGAASAVLVEQSRVAAATLRESVALLAARTVSVAEEDALDWLARQPPVSMDLVFCDPPFGRGLETIALRKLAGSGCLARGGLVYLESARAEPAPVAGPHWQVLKEKVLGEVRMQLLKKCAIG